jgi:hypothetical protein
VLGLIAWLVMSQAIVSGGTAAPLSGLKATGLSVSRLGLMFALLFVFSPSGNDL